MPDDPPARLPAQRAPTQVRVGHGPAVLLIHGSATDHATWTIQLASSLREHITMIAYDRTPAASVEAFADEAIQLLAHDRMPVIVGSSFGAVIALDVARRYGSQVAGAILIEPPMPADDAGPAAPQAFLAEFDLRVERDGGPAAAEFFLRTVLGDRAYEAMPRAFAERSKAKWAAIRNDSAALIAYRPRYDQLAAVSTPVLLLGGERSATYFRPTLEALARALPHAELAIVPAAGHMLHAEAPKRFADHVRAMVARVGLAHG